MGRHLRHFSYESNEQLLCSVQPCLLGCVACSRLVHVDDVDLFPEGCTWHKCSTPLCVVMWWWSWLNSPSFTRGRGCWKQGRHGHHLSRTNAHQPVKILLFCRLGWSRDDRIKNDGTLEKNLQENEMLKTLQGNNLLHQAKVSLRRSSNTLVLYTR